MPSNNALWLTEKRAGFEIRPAPYPTPGATEIVVKTRALAINPVDRLAPVLGDLVFPWIKYPFIMGSDVAGDVVEVGQAVSRFKVGDRVVGHAVGSDKKRNRSAEGAFQAHVVLRTHMTSPIPDAMTYETACVLPLGLSTAACGLFEKDQLALRHPSANPVPPTGKTLLVWGGSTSVGSNAIQLAVAAGYDVITTASPTNFDYVKSLGALQAFDYNSPTVVKDVIAAFDGRTIAGALAIGLGSAEACLEVVRASKGDKVIATATPPVSFDKAPQGAFRTLWLIPNGARMLAANISIAIRARMAGIRTNFIFGSTLHDNEVGPMIYVDFLPKALAEGRYIAAPKPMVVGHGLEQIQTGLEVLKTGVSARKVVISL